jgi:hypothetical protein
LRGAVEVRVGEALDLPAEEVAVGAERPVVAAVGVREALDLGGAEVPRRNALATTDPCSRKT